MSDLRADYQICFQRANTRLASLSPARCRQLELDQVRALRFAGARPPMVRQLVRDLKDQPVGEDDPQRCHHTLRRLFRHLLQDGQRAEVFETAANAYLDGQTELAARWLTADVLVRPWKAP